MSRTPPQASKAKTAAPGNQQSTRDRDAAGDVLLPLLGDEEEAQAPDSTHNQPSTQNGEFMRKFWTFTYEVAGDTLVVEILDVRTGNFKVLEHHASAPRDDAEDSTPHAFLDRVQERKGKVITSETVHVVTDFDFDGITRKELERFIASLISYVTNFMFTYIPNREYFDEFVEENRVQ